MTYAASIPGSSRIGCVYPYACNSLDRNCNSSRLSGTGAGLRSACPNNCPIYFGQILHCIGNRRVSCICDCTFADFIVIRVFGNGPFSC